MNNEHLPIKYSRGEDQIRTQYQYRIYLTICSGYEPVVNRLMYLIMNTYGGDFKLQEKSISQQEHILCLYHDTEKEIQNMIDAFFLTLHGFNIGVDTVKRKEES